MAEQGQRGFEDLECYQLALQVLREAYRVAGLLPPEEKFNLAHQMRKAAVSSVLNIAEGYGRYHYLTWTVCASTTLPAAPSTKP